MVDKILEGTFDWIKTDPNRPEEYTNPQTKVTKKSWSAIIYPTKDSLDEIRIMQAKGVKNIVKMTDDKWNVKFSCPIDKKNKAGKVTQTFPAPTVVDGDGKTIEGLVANGAKGFMKLDLYEHPVQGGKTAHAARFMGLKLTEWKPYGSDQPTINTEVKQENYF